MLHPGDKSSAIGLCVVIPNYNHGHCLSTALDSALGQSVSAEAIYVVDDCSTDDSVEFIRSYAARHPTVHLVERQKNGGPLVSFNEALPLLRGSHVFPLAADDYLLPGAFDRAEALLREHPEAGLILSDYIEVTPGGEKRHISYKLAPGPAYFPPAQVGRVIRGCGLVGQCFFHIARLRELGGFPAPLRWHADHFACVALAGRGGLCYTPEPGAAFVKSQQSFSAKGMAGQAQIQVLANFLEYLDRPEFADLRPIFAESHALGIFEAGLLRALCQPRNRTFLTPSLVAQVARRRILRRVRHPLPASAKQWLRRALGRAAPEKRTS